MPSPITVPFSDLLSDLETEPGIAFSVLTAAEPFDPAALSELEQTISSNESGRRRENFIVGRLAACRAMRLLGISAPGPVPRGDKREPLWPASIVGSITHSYPWTMVAVGRVSDIFAIGIDIENSQQVTKEDISREICTDSELAWVCGSAGSSAALAMLFSSKEAVFKAFSTVSGKYFEFKDVQLVWHPETKCFRGELLVDLCDRLRRGRQFEVQVRRNEEWVFSFLIERRARGSLIPTGGPREASKVP